jgi:anti-sigma-K factor RskA
MKITSLRDLPQDVAPPRDLWPEIAAQIAPQAMVAPARHTGGAVSARPSQMRWLAAAAMVAAVAVGIWVGRDLLPLPGTAAGTPTLNARNAAGSAANVNVAYVPDARYQRQRAQLLASLQTQLATLPPESRAKVLASLAAIDKAKADLESALGKDPSNALLQGLLVNTYQDEMRVLAAVHTASDAGKGI